MTTFRAHYDGKVIVPDEPVDLPVDEPLLISVRRIDTEDSENLTLEERLRRQEKISGRIYVPPLPSKKLRPDIFYDERDRG